MIDIERVTQRLKSNEANIRRFSQKKNQVYQSHWYKTDKRGFYQCLNQERRETKILPELAAVIYFLSRTWRQSHKHQRGVKGCQMGKIFSVKYSENHQQKYRDWYRPLKQGSFGRLTLWKTTCSDREQDYWVRNFCALQELYPCIDKKHEQLNEHKKN